MDTPNSEKDKVDFVTPSTEQKVYNASVASREDHRFGSTSLSHRKFEPYHVNVSRKLPEGPSFWSLTGPTV